MVVQIVPPVAAGYVYRTRMQVTGEEPVFPLGCQLRAQVRPYDGGPIAGTLTTENGGITRVDDQTVDLVIPAEVTGRVLSRTKVALVDLARVDLDPDEWVGVKVRLPVITPVTAPVSEA